MMNQTIFKRYEYKYLLTEDQKKDLLAYIKPYMKPDRFGCNTLVSYTPVREYNSVVISCAELSDGSTYTIHTGENSREVTMEGLVYTDGEVTNAPGQGGGQKQRGGPMGENTGDSDNSDDSDRPTLPQGQETPPDMQNGERPQGDPPQGNPGDSSNEQTKEESDGQK